MALKKCPECKRSISDTSVRCPFCDFVLIDKVVAVQKMPTKQRKKRKNASANRVLKFLRFDWFYNFIDNIACDLSYIPLIGPVLAFVFNLLCAMVIVAIVFGGIMAGLYYVNPMLATEVMMGSFTIWIYFKYYRKRKQTYYFWYALVLTILFPIVFAFV